MLKKWLNFIECTSHRIILYIEKENYNKIKTKGKKHFLTIIIFNLQIKLDIAEELLLAAKYRCLRCHINGNPLVDIHLKRFDLEFLN